ncbi:MAG TPA: asparagine synthase (glutamine-hydrolyzing) [Terriglobia bacterium]|nr:asparagine synthase (glutamine-hydrolyzing) [Terriglobia bacterium]
MCGICGLHNLAFEPLADPGILDRMSARIEHRGPDSHGKFERPHLALGIRRLSIIDLETGDQPLSNESGEVTLVFNGEIYNYRELREKLLEHGHQFRTHSDGEMIAHLYEELGVEFVRELNGMFAIALWDDRARRLVLARDRAGEKPLFYWRQGNLLVFGSEIRTLLEVPGIDRTLDAEALAQYAFYGYFPSPRSVYKEIRKLPAAHRMVVENGELRIEPYWRLRDYLRAPDANAGTKYDENSTLVELRDRLRQAAVSRLVSDVPLGVFLSGGVDSSTLVALMSELTPGNVNTFSVAFPQKTFNEEPYASLVARHFHTRHHVMTADEPAMRGALDFLAQHLDEPVADPAVIPTYLMSRFARSEIKVALSGEGSDELFGGYPTYIGARLARAYLRLPRLLRRQVFDRLQSLFPVSAGAVPLGMYLRRFSDHIERAPAERHQIWFGMLAPSELDRLFARDWRGPAPASSSIFGPLQQVLEGARFEDDVAETLYLDFCMYLQDNLLVKIDRASMACSLELRTPFLDHRLIEFAAGIPSSRKVRGFQLKRILKRAVSPWLPRKIVDRQKRGFSVPIARWMRQELRPLLEDALGEERLKRQGIFDAATVRRLLAEHWSGHADHRKALWMLLSFQLWHERWVKV